jgi:hypothetical protein
MAELKVSKEKAEAAYNAASDEVKKAFRNLLGDAIVPFNFNELPENEQEVLRAYARLRRKAAERFPEWKPDFTDRKVYKYYPWFDYKAGVGFVVGDTYYDGTNTYAHVGSRLCFPTSKDAIEFAKENIEDYNIILTQ